jgi:hypothetical protein
MVNECHLVSCPAGLSSGSKPASRTASPHFAQYIPSNVVAGTNVPPFEHGFPVGSVTGDVDADRVEDLMLVQEPVAHFANVSLQPDFDVENKNSPG